MIQNYRSVHLYNSDKPHIELKRKTPVELKMIIFVTEQKPKVISQRRIKHWLRGSTVGPLGQRRKTSGSISLKIKNE